MKRELLRKWGNWYYKLERKRIEYYYTQKAKICHTQDSHFAVYFLNSIYINKQKLHSKLKVVPITQVKQLKYLFTHTSHITVQSIQLSIANIQKMIQQQS